MPVHILYFARLKDVIGRDSDLCDLPASVTTPTLLVDWLAEMGPGYAAAFADRARLRCAVDQVMVGLDTTFSEPAEIAFFPPVTGG